MKDIELLAPSGGLDTVHAAVSAGADAIYIGGRFSARSDQAVFTDDMIAEAVEYCHIYGVDVHVAVNTLIKEREMNEAVEYVKYLSQIGVDAVIIQDLGLASIIKQLIPDLLLHASTQMTVSTLSGVKKLCELGFSRVVLARELTRDEIEYICKNTDVEIEVFVHGALCMSYSGQCLMSSIIGGRSGNRGKCAQPCRLPYEIISDKGRIGSGYILSPKDLSLADEIETLREIGVCSLKIEGRLKRPEYVATVVSTLRECIDSKKVIDQKGKKQLLDAFNRGGFTKGYFIGRTGRDMMSGIRPGNIAEGVYPPKIHDIVSGQNIKRIPVNIFASLCIGKPLSVKITDCDGNTAYASSDEVAELATSKPLDEGLLCERLQKLGDTAFVCDGIFVEVDGISTMRAKDINLTRRTALDKLAALRIKRAVRHVYDYKKITSDTAENIQPIISAEVRTAEQAKACRELNIDRIYANGNIGTVEKLSPVPRKIERCSGDICLVSNIGEWYDNKDKNLICDYRLNVTNSYTLSVLSEMDTVCLSPELNLKEISDIKKTKPIEVIVYGKLTLMTMANCPLRASGVCRKKDKSLRLRDRKNQVFGVLCNSDCTAELINSKPIYMADKISDIVGAGVSVLRLVFTDETYDETKGVIEEYTNALLNKKASSMADNTFTRGHFYRGVL